MPRPKIQKETPHDPTAQEVHELYQTLDWGKGVDSLFGRHKIGDYMGLLTDAGGTTINLVNEFSSLVNHLGLRGQFCRDEYLFIAAIENTIGGYRRKVIEAAITQELWNGLDPTTSLYRACIPYASVDFLAKINGLAAGSTALMDYLREDPYRKENLETKATRYINRNAKLFDLASIDHQNEAKSNNYRLWLSEPLIRRICVACKNLNEWNVGEEVQQMTVDELLHQIELQRSQRQSEWDGDIKKLQVSREIDVDGRTLVGTSKELS
jgi:hypothetical protein